MPIDPTKVRARREKLKLTQLAAASAAAMPQPNWARIESGAHSDPNLSTAERLARVLACRVDDLLA